MSNALTRAIPKTLQNKSKVTMSRTSYRLSRIGRWFSRNGEDIFVYGGAILLVGILIASTICAIYFPLHAKNQEIWKASQAYHYKPGQGAFCDHGNDSTQSQNAGWIPCTVVSANNKEGTSYFVSYGTLQANITPNHMHRTAQ